MSCSLQICAILAFTCWVDHSNGSPLFQGFKIQKGLDFQLTPFEFKPISLFKENWSPFGMFGFRKGIQKRDLERAVKGPKEKSILPPPVAPAPVYEFSEESKESTSSESSELNLGPDPVNIRIPHMIRIPKPQDFKPVGLYTDVGSNQVNNNLVERPSVVMEGIYGELPPRPVGPISVQPIQAVIPLITPPPPVTSAPTPIPEIPPTEGPFVRGSKYALYFGNVLVQLVSQFLTNARLQFQQFAKPTPAPAPVSN